MEALSKSLQPHKEFVGNVASFVTIAQFFSGIFICQKIYNAKSTKDTASMPFVGGIIIGILVLKYAIILEDQAMFQVNVAAILLNILYLGVFHKYSQSKWSEIYKNLTMGLAIVAAVFAYLKVEDPKNIEYRYGLIVTILSLSLLGSPLLELKDMISKKDASSIPFPLVSSGAVVSFLWLVYGVILLNEFMILQNVIGLVLCIIQLVLYIKYPAPPPSTREKDE